MGGRMSGAGWTQALTMLTSEMLSMLSTCTSMPTGMAEPAAGREAAVTQRCVRPAGL